MTSGPVVPQPPGPTYHDCVTCLGRSPAPVRNAIAPLGGLRGDRDDNLAVISAALATMGATRHGAGLVEPPLHPTEKLVDPVWIDDLPAPQLDDSAHGLLLEFAVPDPPHLRCIKRPEGGDPVSVTLWLGEAPIGLRGASEWINQRRQIGHCGDQTHARRRGRGGGQR